MVIVLMPSHALRGYTAFVFRHYFDDKKYLTCTKLEEQIPFILLPPAVIQEQYCGYQKGAASCIFSKFLAKYVIPFNTRHNKQTGEGLFVSNILSS